MIMPPHRDGHEMLDRSSVSTIRVMTSAVLMRFSDAACCNVESSPYLILRTCVHPLDGRSGAGPGGDAR